MAFAPKKVPKSNLGYHRLLAPTAGVRVSTLCLGGMNFGTIHEQLIGKCDKDTAFRIMDTFFEQGGNFIDTANGYHGGESEQWIGDWMVARQNRDQMFIATKYTLYYPSEDITITANSSGNSSKSLKVSFAASLRKLQTGYIDLLYLHWWDFSSSISEIMQSLHHLVVSGKVLYLGVSDTPAWIVSKANEYARNHGLTQFSVYQGHWSAAMRDFERDIIPMCQAEGMALAPWGALGRGAFKLDQDWESRDPDGRQMTQRTGQTKAVTLALDEIAKAKNTQITSVALAYVLHKAPYVFPIVGGRKVEHLQSNIDALALQLSDEDVKAIESATPFDVGFPNAFLFDTSGSGVWDLNNSTKDVALIKLLDNLGTVEKPRPIPPHQKS